MAESVLPELAKTMEERVLLPEAPPSKECQQLWFMLAKTRWRSLALVPADEGGSTAALAASLAEVGRQLRDGAVTALNLPHLDYITASGIADAIAAAGRGEGVPPNLQIIVAIPPVLDDPLGVAVAHAVDAAVLCVEMGKARLKSARKTMELVGRERFVGSILMRP
ncbi:conserved hypothetical protein [Anaeromyxobacter sp. K]|uniref:Uncharacterized protein n=1 Tax=Anaeromyxobacter dehalogenans (strain ATCC BAA-258 / DSM 21875 / 2CP-1) TaxID=455488 RepID=B8JFB4_ANAD2|nr:MULTISPECIES: hypothetical protein [Anaeromyxobacter]ACG74086.1 conserved hypothetical protein [Anaeromyxobacter sp. K]ACL66291.1 conserved hypothetical protein [Anaeromyxobacter dehalogenans 2CP-1]